MTKDKTDLVHDQTIEHKSPLHSFQPGSSGTTRAGGPLVQIFGDKFTGGIGHFMKQVTCSAADIADACDDQGLCGLDLRRPWHHDPVAAGAADAAIAARRDDYLPVSRCPRRKALRLLRRHRSRNYLK